MVFADFCFQSCGVESGEGLGVSVDCVYLVYVRVVGEVAYDCGAYSAAA